MTEKEPDSLAQPDAPESKMPGRDQLSPQLSQPGRGTWIVQLLAYAVIVIAGFKAAADFLIPVLLAIVLTLICVHPTRILRRWGLPSTPAILIVVAMVVVCSVSVTTFVGNSLTLFGSTVPVYVEAFKNELSHIDDKWLAFIKKQAPDKQAPEKDNATEDGKSEDASGEAGPGEANLKDTGSEDTGSEDTGTKDSGTRDTATKDTGTSEKVLLGDKRRDDKSPEIRSEGKDVPVISSTDQGAKSVQEGVFADQDPAEKEPADADAEQGPTAFEKGLGELIDVGFIMRLVADTTSGALSALSNLAVILLIMIFMLFEAEGLPGKIRRAIGREDANLTNYRSVGDKVFSYVLLKTLMSFATAACVCALLTAMSVEFPVLLALIAFLFNFIPTIGSFIAGIPTIVLSLFSIQGDTVTLTPGTALVVGIGYLVINISIGNFIEPKVLGKSLGLSPLVIILSLMFWSWILGPIGMLLSVPLTMVLKIIFDSSHDFRALGVLLGPTDELEPDSKP